MAVDSGGSVERAVSSLELVKRVWELAAWVIGAFSLIVGFVNGHGGVVSLLVQVAGFGFACYIALFVAVPCALLLVGGLERATRRTGSRYFAIGAGVVLTLVVGALIRFKVFYEGFGEPGDLDAIGTASCAIVGAAILLVPIVTLLWFRHSRPAGTVAQ